MVGCQELSVFALNDLKNEMDGNADGRTNVGYAHNFDFVGMVICFWLL